MIQYQDTPAAARALERIAQDAQRVSAPTVAELIDRAIDELTHELHPIMRKKCAAAFTDLRTARTIAANQREESRSMARALYDFAELGADIPAGRVSHWWYGSGRPALDKWQGAAIS